MQVNDVDATSASAGEICKLKLEGAGKDEVSEGFVLCSPGNLCRTATVFDAEIRIHEEPRSGFITAGSEAVMYMHRFEYSVLIKFYSITGECNII